MPIGIISDEQLLAELANCGGSLRSPLNIPPDTPDSPTNTSPEDNSEPAGEQREATVVDIKRGRGPAPELPEAFRKLISSSAVRGESNSTVARAFGISESSVSAYKNGATSTSSYQNPSPPLAQSNKNLRENIANKAHRRILSALKGITQDKIDSAGLKNLSTLAKDMSVVAKNMEDRIADSPSLNMNGPNYVFYAPRVKKEDEYEVIVHSTE